MSGQQNADSVLHWRHADGSIRVDHMDAREGDYYGLVPRRAHRPQGCGKYRGASFNMLVRCRLGSLCEDCRPLPEPAAPIAFEFGLGTLVRNEGRTFRFTMVEEQNDGSGD